MPGQPRTIDVGIPGPAQTQSFELDPTVTFDLEAVYVELDTTGAGGPVTAELVLLEKSGVVIAKKRQSEAVDPGGGGSATWALRLSDDAAGTTPPAGALLEAVSHDTVTLPSNPGGAATVVPWTLDYDTGIWDYTVPTNPVCRVSGLLVATLQVEQHPATPLAPGETLFAQLLIPGPAGVFPGTMNLAQQGEATASVPAVNLQLAAAGLITPGIPAVLALNNNGALPIDVTYVIRSDLIEA